MMRFLTLLLLSIFSAQAATTYFIDCEAGNDANAGTSTGAPWKNHPYMRSWTGGGTYSHVAGDAFIFKGGVTWTNPCFGLQIGKGGSVAGNTYDYYGTTNTWYTGASWTNAYFDFEWKSVTNNGSTANQNGAGVLINCSTGAVNNILFGDGIVMKRHWGRKATSGGTAGCMTFVLYGAGVGATTNIILTNTAIVDWDMPVPGDHEDSGDCGGITYKDLTDLRGFTMINSELSDQNAASVTGTGIKAFMTVQGCRLHHMTSLWLGNGTIISNTCWEVGYPATDPSAHENGFYMQNNTTAYGNYLSNFYAQGFYISVGAIHTAATPLWNTNTGSTVSRFYNNTVIMGSSFGAAFDIDTEVFGGSGGTTEGLQRTGVAVYGNTAYRASDPVIKSFYRGSNQKYGYLLVADNHIINNQANTNGAASLDPLSCTNTIQTASNIVQTLTQSTAQGMTISNAFIPPSFSTSLYRKGWDMNFPAFNLSDDRFGVARTVPPDVGAYQFVAGGSPPVITFQPMDQTVYVGDTATFTVTATGTGALQYQWYRDGGLMTGETASTLNITNCQLTDNGAVFYVIVTDVNGSTFSNNATLTVYRRPNVLKLNVGSGYVLKP